MKKEGFTYKDDVYRIQHIDYVNEKVQYLPHIPAYYEYDEPTPIVFYESIEELLENIIEQFNSWSPFRLTVDDLCIKFDGPWRARKWYNSYIITFKAYDDIEDKEGYLKLMTEPRDYPCYVLGHFTTNYEEETND